MTDSQRETINNVISRAAEAMNVSCRVELTEEIRGDKTYINAALYAPEHAHLLIGKNGQNLQALEHLIRATAFKESPSTLISLDVNDYKRAKASQVLELARQAVAKVRNTRKAEALIPMTSYERRVVHMELASMPDIVTESIGQEPQRRIVIKPL